MDRVYDQKILERAGFAPTVLLKSSDLFRVINSDKYSYILSKNVDYDHDDYEEPITISAYSQIPALSKREDYILYAKNEDITENFKHFTRKLDSIKIKGSNAYIEIKTIKALIESFDLTYFDDDSTIFHIRETEITKTLATKIYELLP